MRLLVPRGYAPDRAAACVVVLEGPREHLLGELYAGSRPAQTGGVGALVLIHSPLRGDDLAAAPAPLKVLGMAARIAAASATDAGDGERAVVPDTFGALGDAQRAFHLDRDRVVVDAGRGSTAEALAMVTYAPDRFAGLVLRDPARAGSLRLDGLAGLPVLLLRTTSNAAECDALHAHLERVTARASVQDVSDPYPHPAAQAQLASWIAAQRRQLFPARVVFAPNDDTARNCYWVRVRSAEPLDRLPFLQVESDRARNRIEVVALGVNSLTLLLNDAIVDLDLPFSVRVNGVALETRRLRSRRFLAEAVYQRFDPGFLFSTMLSLDVPRRD
jgi:hypothetical protein